MQRWLRRTKDVSMKYFSIVRGTGVFDGWNGTRKKGEKYFI